MYSSLAIKLYEAPDSDSAARLITEFSLKLREKRPSLDEFKVAFREVMYTNSNSKQKNLVRYILRKFSVHYSYKYPVDFDDLSIEHLHPQSLINDSDWPESLVGCLGNLIFLDKKMNEKIGNKPFFEKKNELISAGYSLPPFINGLEEWDSSDVNTHVDLMAEEAYHHIWKI